MRGHERKDRGWPTAEWRTITPSFIDVIICYAMTAILRAPPVFSYDAMNHAYLDAANMTSMNPP